MATGGIPHGVRAALSNYGVSSTTMEAVVNLCAASLTDHRAPQTVCGCSFIAYLETHVMLEAANVRFSQNSLGTMT